MATHKSAAKRAVQSEKRRERNSMIRSATKSAVKIAITSIEKSGSRDEALKALAAGERALQKAVSKGVIPKQRASRKTARIASLLNKKFKPATSARA